MRSDKQIEASRRSNGALDQQYTHIDYATRAALAHDYSPRGTQSLRELEHHASRYSHACDRALRRRTELRQLPPPCPPPPPEKAAA